MPKHIVCLLKKSGWVCVYAGDEGSPADAAWGSRLGIAYKAVWIMNGVRRASWSAVPGSVAQENSPVEVPAGEDPAQENSPVEVPAGEDPAQENPPVEVPAGEDPAQENPPVEAAPAAAPKKPIGRPRKAADKV